jgi:hypothetical protein
VDGKENEVANFKESLEKKIDELRKVNDWLQFKERENKELSDTLAAAQQDAAKKKKENIKVCLFFSSSSSFLLMRFVAGLVFVTVFFFFLFCVLEFHSFFEFHSIVFFF